ncbi:hypothetical protein DSM112329_03914 [Paraconexibacter sp. AEG42_29]|uniref:DUF3159 domain-containing protein n=1 Tax=Paraconexibacter sp. AEG42_29 TaxID=2997339 RepID=A0AAU7AZK3_9ACTN
MGGVRGTIESSVPPVAFVAAYTVTGQNLEASAIAAVAVAIVLAIARIARRETPQYTLTGLVGVGLAAFIATRTGKAENFFLPGLLINAAYAGAYLVSILIRRPLIGLIVSGLSGGGKAWREDPVQLRIYTRASWLWVGLFLTRLAVQLPLYLAGAVTLLGVARTAMGLPLFGIGIWLTWLLIRDHHAIGDQADGDTPGDSDPGTPGGPGDSGDEDPDAAASLVR